MNNAGVRSSLQCCWYLQFLCWLSSRF